MPVTDTATQLGATTSPADAESPLPAATTAADRADATLVEGDLLVEDVSIDGMCGVY